MMRQKMSAHQRLRVLPQKMRLRQLTRLDVGPGMPESRFLN
jgi:hypothetical protein